MCENVSRAYQHLPLPTGEAVLVPQPGSQGLPEGSIKPALGPWPSQEPGASGQSPGASRPMGADVQDVGAVKVVRSSLGCPVSLSRCPCVTLSKSQLF